jgi:glucosamine-6-phosphate deaminase
MLNVAIYPTAKEANEAAADWLVRQLTDRATKNVMVAAGNTPLELYRLIAGRNLGLGHLTVFALDEYVGVPLTEARNCANLLRRSVAQAWKIDPAKFHTVSSMAEDAIESVTQHERLISKAGGIDVNILGLGQNGHLGFNEPGSDEQSTGRLLDLDALSVEANRQWFGGDYAPA